MQNVYWYEWYFCKLDCFSWRAYICYDVSQKELYEKRWINHNIHQIVLILFPFDLTWLELAHLRPFKSDRLHIREFADWPEIKLGALSRSDLPLRRTSRWYYCQSLLMFQRIWDRTLQPAISHAPLESLYWAGQSCSLREPWSHHCSHASLSASTSFRCY